MPIGVAQYEPHPEELQVTGDAGSVFVMDSRCWHAVPARPASTEGDDPRVSVAVRYSPWHVSVDVLVPGGSERERLLAATQKADPEVGPGNTQPPLPREVWEGLPAELQPLLYHRVEDRPRF